MLVRNVASMQIAETEALYLRLHANLPEGDAAIERDLPYGPHPRHRLDIAHRGAAPGTRRPVLVFVHGGGFTTGERVRPGTPFHDNVMRWADGAGLVGVNMSYRLAPEHAWPAGGEDVLLGLQWLVRNIERWGGDPARIVVMGHSAGAAHVAEALARALEAQRTEPWAGTVLVSGIHAPELVESNPGRAAYYGADRALWAARGAAARMRAPVSPVLVLSSALEPGEFAQQARVLCEHLQRRGATPDCQVLEGHNHFSPIFSLGSPDTSFAEVLGRFIAGIA